MFYLQVIILLLFTGCLHGYRRRTFSAEIKQERHADVLKMMCTKSVDACPCIAKNLVVTVKGRQGHPLPCGSSVTVESLALNSLNIKPPVEVKFRQVFQFVIWYMTVNIYVMWSLIHNHQIGVNDIICKSSFIIICRTNWQCENLLRACRCRVYIFPCDK